jgi:hypothetical protein
MCFDFLIFDEAPRTLFLSSPIFALCVCLRAPPLTNSHRVCVCVEAQNFRARVFAHTHCHMLVYYVDGWLQKGSIARGGHADGKRRSLPHAARFHHTHHHNMNPLSFNARVHTERHSNNKRRPDFCEHQGCCVCKRRDIMSLGCVVTHP